MTPLRETSVALSAQSSRAVSGYLPTLDGWRAIAILGVMMAHITPRIFDPTGTHPSDAVLRYAQYGALGVNVFFGISGFLITTRLLDEERLVGYISLRNFYIRRACRILPASVVFLVTIGLLGIAGLIPLGRMEWVSALTFWRNYLPRPFPPDGWYTGHFWSLAIEEHFYLLWPSVMVLVGTRRAIAVALAGAMAVLVWNIVHFRLHLRPWPLPRTELNLDGLLWGCVVALLLDLPGQRERIARILSFPVWLAMLTAFVLTTVYSPPLKLLWRPVLLAFLLVGTVLRPHTLVGRVLELPAMRWIGRLSYSLYLWQQIFLVKDVSQLSPSPALRMIQTIPVNLIVTIVVAATSYQLIERPLIRLGHRLAKPATEGRKDL